MRDVSLTEPRGYLATFSSTQPCSGTRGSARVDSQTSGTRGNSMENTNNANNTLIQTNQTSEPENGGANGQTNKNAKRALKRKRKKVNNSYKRVQNTVNPILTNRGLQIYQEMLRTPLQFRLGCLKVGTSVFGPSFQTQTQYSNITRHWHNFQRGALNRPNPAKEQQIEYKPPEPEQKQPDFMENDYTLDEQVDSVVEVRSGERSGQNSTGEQVEVRAEPGIKAGIADRFRGCLLSQEQINTVRERLTAALTENLNADTISPQFFESKFGPKEIVFNCANEETRKWLENVVTTFGELWKGAELIVLNEENVKKGSVVLLSIPEIINDPKSFLQMLKFQNRDVKTELWTVLRHSIEGDNTSILFSIDKESFQSLEHKDFKLFYMFGTVSVRDMNNENLKRN